MKRVRAKGLLAHPSLALLYRLRYVQAADRMELPFKLSVDCEGTAVDVRAIVGENQYECSVFFYVEGKTKCSVSG
jgi:hypothetical protein